MATARFLTAATLSVACLSLGACSGRQNAAPSAPPPAAATGSVWVADEGADSLSVIDAATHSIAMTMTGIPSAIQPTDAAYQTCPIVNNSFPDYGWAQIVAGTITFGQGFANNTTGFNNANVKGIPAGWVMRYRLT